MTRARFKALVLATFALGLCLRLPTFGRPMLSDDEAIYAVTADAMARGDHLYRDVVDHKPPLVYHLYQAAFAVGGRYQMQAAHALVVLAVLLTAASLLALAGGDPPAPAEGLAAAALFLIFSTTWHDYDALAANCELFLLVPQTLAAWGLLRDLRAPARGGRGAAIHLAVGALVGTSALLKYQGITFLGASLGMLLWWQRLGRGSVGWALRRGLCQVAGALAAPAAYLLASRAAGNAGAALYWFRFNFAYVGAGLTGAEAIVRGLRRTALVGGVALVPYALGLAAAATTAAAVVQWLRRPTAARVDEMGPSPVPPDPVAVLGLLWLCTSTIALCAGGRFFGHYFHLVLPPLCLLAAPGSVRLWRRAGWTRAALVALCALPALAFLGLATVGRSLAARLDEREPAYGGVAARIDSLTAPDERIFVWGNSPQLYVLARRPMGARFSSSNFVTGESPGTPTETGARNADLNQDPRRWQMLFDDLERRRPALLVDAAAAGWDGYGKYPLDRYPRLRRYVDAHYRPLEVSAGVVLYRRLDRTR
ncbi:MAG TPA: hypothetical protein VKZ18_28285 [Polyangia bacterium]|nr:hypothetical protein [Polyangia bacterium]